MDQRSVLRRWLLFVLLAGALAACREAPVEPLQSAAWIAADRDVVSVLTEQPRACDLTAAMASDPRVAEGEALFNSPLLLGGQAAKAGLSCGACHRNGRGNPDFAFGNNGAPPGHADVTDALFGHQRDDGVFNPVAIPDLAELSGRKVARDEAALVAFISAQLTEEFDAAPPASETVRAVALYVAAISSAACAPGNDVMSWRQEFARAQKALQRSEAYAATSPEAEAALRLAARASLGRLHERFPFRGQADVRQKLETLSMRIGAGETGPAMESDLRAIARTLEREASRSLYDPDTMRTALDEQ